MTTTADGRVFWLGMHVVLSRTELPRLRELGYEVFNPPYIADVYDQSAELKWDAQQPTTLPSHVFKELSRFNFFYSQITPRIAELLNAHFETVIVTINVDWLQSVLRAFRKRVIFRTYGQPQALSPQLASRHCWRRIQEREDFYFVPFAEEVIEEEQDWLRARSRVVPYKLRSDVFEHADTWDRTPRVDEVMVNVPNIQNAYYADMHRHLNYWFPEQFLKIYGVQRAVVEDVRVVGTLSRGDLMLAYRSARGFFYPYHEKNVCYLQPIEMMVVGGPVVYHSGCLLDRLLGEVGPGRADDVEEQRRKVRWLLRGDTEFVRDVVAAQEPARRRYSPEYVDPIFDRTFRELLGPAPTGTPPALLRFEGAVVGAARTRSDRPRIWCLAHFVGQVFRYTGGHAFAVEGIPRVIAKVIEALVPESDIVLTTYSHSAIVLVDMFRDLVDAGRLTLYVLDDEQLVDREAAEEPAEEWQRMLTRAVGAMRQADPADMLAEDVAMRLAVVGAINADPRCAAVFVPHYHLFPEYLRIRHGLVSYIPDYTPHFFPGVPFGRTLAEDAENAKVGRALAARSRIVITNSEFTRSYLEDTALEVDAEKVRVIPMPLLVGRTPPLESSDRNNLEQRLGGVPYVFYPTANRPNKNIAFLLRVFAAARRKVPNLRLVLTCSLHDYAPAQRALEQLSLSEHVEFYPGVPESVLKWLYLNASALCLTSTMEGNFPPQILEAIHYGVPVVSTRLPHITELLGKASDLLALCMPLSERDFVDKLLRVLDDRDGALGMQREAAARLQEHNSAERFGRAIRAAFAEAARPEPEPMATAGPAASLASADPE